MHMRITTRIMFLVFLACSVGKLIAQKTQFPAVYLTDGKNKPFDKEYDFLIPFTAQEDVSDVLLYKHKGVRSLKKSFAKEKGILPTVKLQSEWEKLRDTNFLKVKLRYQEDNKLYSLLKPARKYSLIILKGLTEGSNSLLDSIKADYDSTGGNISSTIGPGIREFVRQRSRQAEENAGIVTFDLDYSKYISLYKDSIRPLQDKEKKAKENDENYKAPCENRDRLFNDSCISFLLKSFYGNGCMKVTVKCLDTCNLLNLLLSLNRLKCENLTPYITGLASLNNLEFSSQYLGYNKYTERKVIIEQNKSDLNRVKNLTEQVLLQLEGGGCAEYRDCLKQMEITISNIMRELLGAQLRINEAQKWKALIEKICIRSGLFLDYAIAGANTFVYNFQARNEMAITPVFGYAYYGFQKDFGGFTPYLGFQVNFQGLNRDDPYRLIPRKTIWQRLCFTTAWTLTGVEEKDKRYDLFSKSSLITCLGYKLGHVAMFNAGGLWFRREDPNPLITRKKAAFTPVLALSINMELEKLVNGFTKLIPIK